MPILPRKRDDEKPLPDFDEDEALDVFLTKMRRSRNGNLWAKWDKDRSISIVTREDGSFSWGIHSADTFESEVDAAAALMKELEQGGDRDA